MNKLFTGFEYLLIDAANQYGMDKLIFEERIQWAMDNFTNLEQLAIDRINSEKDLPNDQKWKEAPLYQKAVMAIRKAQKGTRTGHTVGLDASCSGMQIMSVMTGCIDGARATGLVDPDVRADAYSTATKVMNEILVEEGLSVEVPRKDAKEAIMTAFYGSKNVPKRIFGEDTPELAAFYAAALKVAPGAWDLLQTLLGSWQPWALEHAWKLPDGFDARVKVMEMQELRIEVDELNHATFTHEYYENKGKPRGVANAANVTHSVDAYVLRSMHRRCNYDADMVGDAETLIEIELIERALGKTIVESLGNTKVNYYIEQFNRSTVADVVILPYLDSDSVQCLSTDHLQRLMGIIQTMLQYQPFELITIHDEFKAHPNNLNWVRYQYREILAEIAESNMLDDILSQLYGMPGRFPKLSTDLGTKIRQSNYALS